MIMFSRAAEHLCVNIFVFRKKRFFCICLTCDWLTRVNFKRFYYTISNVVLHQVVHCSAHSNKSWTWMTVHAFACEYLHILGHILKIHMLFCTYKLYCNSCSNILVVASWNEMVLKWISSASGRISLQSRSHPEAERSISSCRFQTNPRLYPHRLTHQFLRVHTWNKLCSAANAHRRTSIDHDKYAITRSIAVLRASLCRYSRACKAVGSTLNDFKGEGHWKYVPPPLQKIILKIKFV